MQLAAKAAELEANTARHARQEERHQQVATALQAAGDRVSSLQFDVEKLRTDEVQLLVQKREADAACTEASRAEKVLQVKLDATQSELERAKAMNASGLDRSNIDGLMQANLLVAEQLESFMRTSNTAEQLPDALPSAE